MQESPGGINREKVFGNGEGVMSVCPLLLFRSLFSILIQDLNIPNRWELDILWALHILTFLLYLFLQFYFTHITHFYIR